MYQVDPASVPLYSHENKPITVASSFLSSGRSWDKFQKGAASERAKLDDALDDRKARWPKSPPAPVPPIQPAQPRSRCRTLPTTLDPIHPRLPATAAAQC